MGLVVGVQVGVEWSQNIEALLTSEISLLDLHLGFVVENSLDYHWLHGPFVFKMIGVFAIPNVFALVWWSDVLWFL